MAKLNVYNTRVSTSKSNIHKLIKSLGSTTQITDISTNAMKSMVSMERDLLQKIMYHSHELMLKEGSRVLTSRTVQLTIRLEYYGQMSQYTIIHGMTAVSRYGSDNYAPIYKDSFVESLVKLLGLFNQMKDFAMVYLAAVIEYTLGEVLETAANYAKQNKRSRITPVDIYNAINNDNELAIIFNNVTIHHTGKSPIFGAVSFASDDSSDDDTDNNNNISDTKLDLDKLTINEKDKDDIDKENNDNGSDKSQNVH